MQYFKFIELKDGRYCAVRNAESEDAQAVLDNFILTHGQTEFLTTYPDEISITLEQEKEYLDRRADSEREVELMAEVGGVIAGTAGIDAIGRADKLSHRANFGISIDKAWWGLGIGRALTLACIECAKEAGYSQLELEVVAENTRAVSLYKSVGFVEYGRNPGGFRPRSGGWQETILMRLELDD